MLISIFSLCSLSFLCFIEKKKKKIELLVLGLGLLGGLLELKFEKRN